MTLRAKRILYVYFFFITAFSLGLAMLSINHFSMIGWLLLSLKVELGVIIFTLMVIGIFGGCGWIANGDDDQSFIAYLKSVVKEVLE